MKKKRTTVSMKDVAALAGVSIGTVSNVLNAPHRVSNATQIRVTDAIEKLGWVCNESARQLRAGRSNSVGIIVFDLANPYFADLLLGAEDYLYDMGYTVNIGNSDQSPEREAKLLSHFIRSRVGGVLMAPIGAAGHAIGELERAGIPTVLLDRTSDSEACGVGVDDIEGGRLAAAHLLGLGHTHIAFVGGPLALTQVRDRVRGAQVAVTASNLGANLEIIETKTLDVAEGRRVASVLAERKSASRPTAVFAANDLIAIGLLQGFVAEGLSVPNDMAIIGYDDIDFVAAAAVPISSIRQPRSEMGRSAAKLLLREMAVGDEENSHVHEATRFSPELVARVSTMGIQ